VSIDTDLPALRLACAEAMAGRPYLSPSLLAALLAHLSGTDGAEPAEPLGLTAREAQVLRHLAGGRSQSDISAVMRISNRTVKHHLGNVYRKLGVHSQTEAIVRAYQHRLVV
jgi:DNA-binding NarL/FixJ family response regulator